MRTIRAPSIARNVSLLFGAMIAVSAACAPEAPKVGTTTENLALPTTVPPPIPMPTSLCEPPDCTVSNCGGEDEPCCPGDKQKCSTGACVDGVCHDDCGTKGQVCCNGSECKSQFVTCSAGVCVECGAVGGLCCPDGSCQSTEQCIAVGDVHICSDPCGGLGDPCCPGAYCNVGVCDDGACLSEPCGDIGYPCCAGGQCNHGSCNSSNFCQ